MECNAFHHWLRNRDIRHAPENTGAIAHMEDCEDCKKLYDLDTQAEQAIALAFTEKDMPPNLAAQIDRRLSLEKAPSFLDRFTSKQGMPFSRLKHTGWIAGITALVLLTALVFSLAPPSFKNLEQISEQAVMDHLKGNRHITFDTATLYQALEILKKELKFNVVLPNLDDQGYFLVGGRLCALGNCRAAYFVIEKQGKTGSLFIMDIDHLDSELSDGSRFTTTTKGCTAQVWKENGQVYAMVF
ncbi:MAG: hypothetical protein KKF12_04180 [Proteobacteria bacterium]|nr:hypothetical protein [Desulfobacula sp.]MBU3951267.1 hypothetical protein [Pseudomonadota bacterium]MBU4129996.1 hypothetical protein [Pseudomonadota bacterium]